MVHTQRLHHRLPMHTRGGVHTQVASNHPPCSRVTVVTCYIYVADTFGTQLAVLYREVLLNHWCTLMHSSM